MTSVSTEVSVGCTSGAAGESGSVGINGGLKVMDVRIGTQNRLRCGCRQDEKHWKTICAELRYINTTWFIVPEILIDFVQLTAKGSIQSTACHFSHAHFTTLNARYNTAQPLSTFIQYHSVLYQLSFYSCHEYPKTTMPLAMPPSNRQLLRWQNWKDEKIAKFHTLTSKCKRAAPPAQLLLAQCGFQLQWGLWSPLEPCPNAQRQKIPRQEIRKLLSMEAHLTKTSPRPKEQLQ